VQDYVDGTNMPNVDGTNPPGKGMPDDMTNVDGTNPPGKGMPNDMTNMTHVDGMMQNEEEKRQKREEMRELRDDLLEKLGLENELAEDPVNDEDWPEVM